MGDESKGLQKRIGSDTMKGIVFPCLSLILDITIYTLKEGKLKPYVRSQAIPEDDDKLFKNVVLESLEDMVIKSGKTVLLQLYSPTCRHSRLLMRTLDEVALAFENHQDVLIAKLDATANDVPSDLFDVEDVPKLFLKSANGNLSEYNGDISKESIIDLIQINRADEPAKVNESPQLKDEL